MAKITIDGKEYDTDTMDPQLKNQIAMLRAADREIQRLNIRLGISQTARNTYARLVKNGLDEIEKK